MMKPLTRKIILVSAFLNASVFLLAQPDAKPKPGSTTATKAKPFKVQTNGRQITIQSKENIKSMMVWTASGHRIVEEKTLNTNSYSFSVPAKEKICFIVIEAADGKRYTEKIGVQ
jgi:hypothetical protein